MTARQRRFWWSAGILATLVGGVTLAYVIGTRSEAGRRWLVGVVERQATSIFGGRASLKIGALRSISFTGLSATNVALLDTAGIPVVHADSVDGTISLRGILFDKAIHIGALSLRGVRLDLTQDFSGPWNIAYIIAGDTTTSTGGPPGYGSNIRIDAITLRDVAIVTVAPWAPHPIFTGAARDSVIAERDSLHDIVHTPFGLLERRRIALERVDAHDAIITQPSHAESSMQIDTLRGTISDPPVRIVSAAGEIRWTPDSLRLDLPRVALPASTGSARGVLSWNNPGPLRYDVLVQAKAGLSDLGWIWDVLPATGAGSADVRMRTLADPYDTEYALTALDVQSMDSHVAGSISVVARPADVLLHSVDLAFTPLQDGLLRRLSYGSIPDSVRGVFDGRLVAKTGGPLTAFRIDAFNGRFRDARIPGAISSIVLDGTVSFGTPASARNVNVRDVSVDLRSARALAPSVPATLDGLLRGSLRIAAGSIEGATINTMALVWTDGVGNRSRVTGDARVGLGSRRAGVETTLQFDPISMRALARLYPASDSALTVRADLAGTVHTTGSLEQLSWDATFGAVGDGTLDLRGTASLIDNTWRATAAGSVDALNARTWVGTTNTPETSINGRVQLDAAGTRTNDGTLALEQGIAAVNLAQSQTDRRPAFDFLGSARLDARRLTVDSATMRVGGVTMDARGALARDSTNSDTLQVTARADTLSQVRAQLTRLAAMVEPADSTVASSLRANATDSLSGEASMSGFLVGSLQDFSATLALGARATQVGNLRLQRLFGSVRADNVLTAPRFDGAATADGVDGIGAVRIASAEFKVADADPSHGRLLVDVSSRDDAHLRLRGGFTRDSGTVDVALDSLRFSYDSVTWRNLAPIHVRSDARGTRIDSLEVRSTSQGMLALTADVPVRGPVSALLRLDRFPIGEATTFATGSEPFDGTVSGAVTLGGTRELPLLRWTMRADSLGLNGTYLPRIDSDGSYADQRLVARAAIRDTLGGSVRAVARVPIDLALRRLDKRTLSDAVDAEVVSDSLRLQALGFLVDGVSDARGVLSGRLAIGGTMDRPVATGAMTLDEFSARAAFLGIAPTDGRMVLRAAQDSLILESLRLRSGAAGDTLSARGGMRFAANEPATVQLAITANTFELARQGDGTVLDLSGNVEVRGPLKRPDVSGRLFVPNANIVFDPLGASTALDLGSDASRELLGLDEVPVAASAAQSLARLGRFFSVSNARVTLGDEVWVQTPEAKVQITGGLAITTSGEKLALDGEINANRGQYRLNLGVVNRSFAVDSGSVRFFGTDAIAPTLDISATNVVRLSTGGEIPVRVHIGGTIERPVVTLSSSDPLFASAPESEIISLLIFGAPTFALDGQSQNTVKAVTGVLLPSIGGTFEGVLQRILPGGFNTLQINTAGGQTKDDLSALSLLDNLSITAGKQIGTNAFLRVNTGICRATGSSASLWYGIAVEYRIARGLSVQAGMDPGSAPCTRLGADLLPQRQFGFDLFREWIF